MQLKSISAELEEHFDILRVIYVPAQYDATAFEAEVHQFGNCEALIYDFKMNGADVELIFQPEFASLFQSKPSILDGDLSIKDVSRFLESGANGLVITSGEEEKVGLRSFEDIQDLMEELEIEE